MLLFCSNFLTLFCPHSFIHGITVLKIRFIIRFFCPVFSSPCRIQWHSFLMRLLSLLISVSLGKMNDSQPCNKYNMRRINFSGNKNGRLQLLIPFQMFRFMALPMSASLFQLCGTNILPSHY